jgi:hypothetical protein
MLSPQQAWAVGSALWTEAVTDATTGAHLANAARRVRAVWARLQQLNVRLDHAAFHSESFAAQWLALAAVCLTGLATMLVAGMLLWALQKGLRRLLCDRRTAATGSLEHTTPTQQEGREHVAEESFENKPRIHDRYVRVCLPPTGICVPPSRSTRVGCWAVQSGGGDGG